MSPAYRYTDVRNTTASKERLMVMLFETALRHMRAGARHLESKDRKAAAPLLEKACQIVLELQSTLKPELAPKLTENLIEIYTFTAAKLCRANITGEVKDVRHAERAFAPIVEGFAQAVAAMGQQGASAASAASATSVAASAPVKANTTATPPSRAPASSGAGTNLGRANLPAVAGGAASPTSVTSVAASTSTSAGMTRNIASRYPRAAK